MNRIRLFESDRASPEGPDRTVELELGAQPGRTLIRFGQTIDEYVEFPEILRHLRQDSSLAQVIRIDLRRLTRINSQGAYNWRGFVREIQAAYTLEFSYLAEPLLTLAALWPDLLGSPRAVIELLEVWFACEKCQTREARALTPRDLKLVDGRVTFPSANCPHCKANLIPDVDESEYFRALL